MIDEDASASFALSTQQAGAALDREAGTVSLAADVTFNGIGDGVNPLDGLDVRVVISGELLPTP